MGILFASLDDEMLPKRVYCWLIMVPGKHILFVPFEKGVNTENYRVYFP